MKKKTKKKLKRLLWLLVAAGMAALIWVPGPSPAPSPRLSWRVPVHLAAPQWPHLPDLSPLRDGLNAPSAPRPAEKPIFGQVVEPAPLTEDQIESALPPLAPLTTVPPLAPSAKPPLAGPREGQTGEARLAIIIDDMGPAPAASGRAARLPAFVALSYLPYAQHLQEQTNAARAAGHEVMLHLPMEPLGHEKPGPDALMTKQSPEEWAVRLDKALGSFSGYVGVNNHMGSKFTLSADGMMVVAQALKTRGVFFVDSRTNANSIAENIMRAAGVKTASRDVFIDDDPSPEAIAEQLERAAALARRKGSALVIGHPHGATLDVLEKWLPRAAARGLTLVPVSGLVE